MSEDKEDILGPIPEDRGILIQIWEGKLQREPAKGQNPYHYYLMTDTHRYELSFAIPPMPMETKYLDWVDSEVKVTGELDRDSIWVKDIEKK